MSAFLCSDETLFVMVYAALKANPLRWGAGTYREAHARGEVRIMYRMDFEQADKAIQMLREENIRSLVYRYPDTEGGTSGLWAESDKGITYPRTLAFSSDPTAVEILKTVHCYEYQACEHPDWEASEAAGFCRSLKESVMRDLPGYDEATGWDWTKEEFQKRRGGCISLSGLIASKRRN